jgi:hypothetical protein
LWPIEAIHGDNNLNKLGLPPESNKVVKQEVVVGLRNENQINHTEGLNEKMSPADHSRKSR